MLAHTHIHIHIHIHMHIHIHIPTHFSGYALNPLTRRNSTDTYLYVFAYTRICAYTHTYTNTHRSIYL